MGVWTIGWGSTKYPNETAVKEGDQITQKEADDFFAITLKGYWDRLKTTPFWDKMTDNQKGALLSFSYNTGWNYGDAGFDTLNFVIEGKHWGDVPAALMRYVNRGTSTEAGLRRRREAEGALWNGG